MTSYKTIKEKPYELMELLDVYTNRHSKEFYLTLRSEEGNNDLEVSARFMYLNRAGFNGLYRVNKKGGFNVPFGKKEKVKLYEIENIIALSEYLNNNNVEIYSNNFIEIFKKAKEGDLFFIDPPYDKENNSFNAYDKNVFGKKEQLELSELIKELDKKNIKFILTNHNTDFIKELYKDFNHKVVSVNRMINSDATKRINSAKEIIIFN